MAVFSLDMVSSSGEMDLKKLQRQLIMLADQLRYTFANLSPEENFSQEAKQRYEIVESDVTTYAEAMRAAQDSIDSLQRTARSISDSLRNQKQEIGGLTEQMESAKTQADAMSGSIDAQSQQIKELSRKIDADEKELKRLGGIVGGDAAESVTVTAKKNLTLSAGEKLSLGKKSGCEKVAADADLAAVVAAVNKIIDWIKTVE